MMADQVRWFENLGTCRCGKPATGTLRGPMNESYGAYCARCAYARLKRAERERERARHIHRAGRVGEGERLLGGHGEPPV